jgi:3-oxoacyl-[acyl-carrier-protein] synthase III
MTEPEDFEIQDTSGLTDADWAEINKLRNAHKKGGAKAVEGAMQQLEAKDLIQYVRVIAAFYPDIVREAIKDAMAELGLTEQDIRELIQKAEEKLQGVSDTKH